MKRFVVIGLFLYLCLLTFGIIAKASETTQTTIHAQEKSYRLVWFDEFNGRTLDNTTWTKVKRQPWEWCKYMTDNDDLYEFSDGKLRLYAKVNDGIEPHDTAHYLTAGITSQYKKTFTYGKIEVRARIKGAGGCWPAIWLKNNNDKEQQYPSRAEIDIIEYYNRENIVHFNAHSHYVDKLKHTKEPKAEAITKIKKNRYNIYTLEILPEQLIWSVNGKVIHTYPNIHKTDLWQYPYGTECFLLLDMQVGNPWLRDIKDREFPAYMDIDWVRVYEYVK